MVNRYVEQKFGIDCFHTAFSFEYGEDFVFRGERHDFAEVTLVTSGRITMTQEENVYTLEAGSIIFHAPMEFHRMQSADGTRPTGYTTSFHTTGILPERLLEGYFVLDSESLGEYETIMARLIPYVRGEESDEYEGQYLANSLCAFLIRHCSARKAPINQGASAKEYNKIASDMARCVYDGYDLGTFAKRNNISLSYLKLLFSKYAGVSPKSYYASLRAAEATRMLRDGASVAEVALKMNFSSAGYFSTFFKKHTGKAPKCFKR